MPVVRLRDAMGELNIAKPSNVASARLDPHLYHAPTRRLAAADLDRFHGFDERAKFLETVVARVEIGPALVENLAYLPEVSPTLLAGEVVDGC